MTTREKKDGDNRSSRTGAELLGFLNGAPTPYHAAACAAARLRAAGFTEIDERERWELEPGHGYFLTRAGSAVVAFRAGTQPPEESGFRILGAHLDSPALKLKLRGAERHYGVCRVPVEVYGGPILSTWLDRDLGIAGRLMVRGEAGELSAVSVKTPHAAAVIPNVAIHLNREVNKGFEYNPQDHLAALVDPGEHSSGEQPAGDERNARFPKAAGELAAYLAALAGVSAEQVLSWDLMLCDQAPAMRLGASGRLYSGGRLDNLVGSWSVLEALCTTGVSTAGQVVVLFDAEEVGSRAGPGADSSFLEGVLARIVAAVGGSPENYYRAMAHSLLVSNDAAHALHPSYPVKYDPDYAPILGEGPAIKLNAKLRYATSASGAARVVQLAEAAGISVQYLAVRSDMRSGTTIGPFGWARTGVDTVEIGVPILAMHSVRETGDLRDAETIVALQRLLLSSAEVKTAR